MDSDITAFDLAREMNIATSDLLARADFVIEQVVREHGVDAARGLSTHVRRRGAITEVTVTRALADRLRLTPH